MYSYMKFIILLGNPVSHIENPFLRDMSTYHRSISSRKQNACVALLCGTPNQEATNSVSNSEGSAIQDLISKKKRKISSQKLKYSNCDYVFGSTAETERLWSHAKYILCDNRKKMSPLVFEALLFLTMTKSFWDQACVATALKWAKENWRAIDYNLPYPSNKSRISKSNSNCKHSLIGKACLDCNSYIPTADFIQILRGVGTHEMAE